MLINAKLSSKGWRYSVQPIRIEYFNRVVQMDQMDKIKEFEKKECLFTKGYDIRNTFFLIFSAELTALPKMSPVFFSEIVIV